MFKTTDSVSNFWVKLTRNCLRFPEKENVLLFPWKLTKWFWSFCEAGSSLGKASRTKVTWHKMNHCLFCLFCQVGDACESAACSAEDACSVAIGNAICDSGESTQIFFVQMEISNICHRGLNSWIRKKIPWWCLQSFLYQFNQPTIAMKWCERAPPQTCLLFRFDCQKEKFSPVLNILRRLLFLFVISIVLLMKVVLVFRDFALVSVLIVLSFQCLFCVINSKDVHIPETWLSSCAMLLIDLMLLTVVSEWIFWLFDKSHKNPTHLNLREKIECHVIDLISPKQKTPLRTFVNSSLSETESV